ncbi:MAG TPA: TadE/TadG family type IV pilus assembly protein [Acidimicrobiales bacterium]|nr:TadE/TadG family type IV pilus assembly protein [Acidimicrobiales bacterium]
MRSPTTEAQRAQGEKGVALVLTALCLITLTLASAFVVDLGNARQERRRIQNAVDSAALAATRSYDGSNTAAAKKVAMDKALTFLRANSIDTPAVATLDVQSYACLSEGCTVEFSFPNDGQKCVGVRVRDLKAPTTFARVIDAEFIHVGAGGLGCRRGLGGATSAEDTPAMFAKGGNCDAGKTFELNGSNVTVNGTMKSNGEIKIPGSSSQFNINGVLHTHTNLEVSGSNNEFAGAVTYGGSFSNGGSGNTFDSGYPKKVTSVPVADWPIDIDIADYVPGGARANAAGFRYKHTSGTLDKSRLQSMGVLTGNVLEPGLYYTSGDIDLDLAGVTISTATPGVSGVTFVSEGLATLKWNTPGHVATPFEPNGLLLFGNYRKSSPDSHKDNCDSSAVSLPDGNGFSWEGIIYVPRGQAKVNGSDGTVVSGSILALALQVSGQHFTINADPSLFPGGADESYLNS